MALIAGRETLEALLALPGDEAARILGELDDAALRRLLGEWPAWVRSGQEPPQGDDWRIWLMLTGRGFGKTLAGAQWVSALARAQPGASIALVAATPDEARRVMIEGRSGLLAAARADEAPVWEPSQRRLRFPSGAEAFVYSGANGEALRGPEHHFAWCDELAKWRQAEAAWDNLMLGLRLGERPRALVTTTPKAIPLLHALIADPGTALTGGVSAANPHVSPVWLGDMERRLAGTRLGRQELKGELFADVEDALWWREMIEKARKDPHPNPLPQAGEGAMRRVVIGVDPPASAGGTCGIVACGMDAAGRAYVLGDHSVAGASPRGWARKVAGAAESWGADRVIAEQNNGGDMVGSTLASVAGVPPVKLVSASRGKIARAEPIAARFEAGQAWFAGRFPALEDQLCAMTADGYCGPGRSPDRADACVWAMTELFKPRGEPSVRRL
ncbi:MAG TPA: terminase family protein [Allosphingosinicella sp.]|nr:terminase family protein [Allosphingosinicella sp.]